MQDYLINRISWLAKNSPDKLAVAFKAETLTYRQLMQRIEGIARLLQKEGIQQGDRVCFTALSKPEMVAIYLGIQLSGGIAVFLDKNSTPQNMSDICKESGAKLLLTDKPMGEYAEDLPLRPMRALYQESENVTELCESILINPDWESIAEILFTTGTTGKPKGVMLSYKAVYHILSNTIQGVGIKESDILLLPLPLNHSFALRVLRAVLYQGATVVLQNGFTFAKEVERNIVLYHCNAMACVPSSFEVMRSQMQESFGTILSNMRFIEFGSGSLTIQQRREITTLLPQTTIYNTWGSSESGGAIFCNISEVVKDENTIGALGRPLDGKVQIKIRGADNVELEGIPSHPGRMLLKGEMQMSGYWNDPEATAQALVDGWLVTGDIAYLQNGYVFMLGRADDIINVGGEKVSPIEVENIAGQYKWIRECACIGVDDPDGLLGQIPVLFVVVKNGYFESEFAKYLASKMERFKLPRRFIQIAELPRNRMQKIDRKALKNIWDNRNMAEPLNPVMQAILSRRSIRHFSEREIPLPVLDMILQAGYHAPSSHNMQSWRFTVLTQGKDIQKLKDSVRVAAEIKKIHFYGFENPKALILVSNDSRNPNGCQDSSCAAENIMLAASSYGIGSVWLNPLVTLRDIPPVKAILDDFGIPSNHIIWSTIALGYPISEGRSLAKKKDVVYYI